MAVGHNLSQDETPFTDLLLAVFNSILEVFLTCAAGYILAKHGILDKKTQKQINRLNVSLFTPALLFSKVAFFLTPEKLKELWVIPIWFIVVTATSMIVGHVSGWLLGLRRSQRSFVMASAMFMNSNALPIALMQSLVVSVPDLAWGSEDNKNTMLGRALTYLTMYSTLGMIVRYSYGVRLLSRADTMVVDQAAAASERADERTPLLAGMGPSPMEVANEILRTHASSSTITAYGSTHPGSKHLSANSSPGSSPPLVDSPPPIHATLPDLPRIPPRPIPQRRRTTFYNSFPNSPNDSRTDLTKYDSTESEGTDSEDSTASPRGDIEAGTTPPRIRRSSQRETRSSSMHRLNRVVRRIKKFWAALNDFMTVPLWASLLSLVVACIQPLQHALLYNLQPVNNAITTAGKCSVPLTLVVLGAYFYTPPAENSSNLGVDLRSKEERTFWQHLLDILHISRHSRSATPNDLRVENESRPGEGKTVFLAVSSRMVITPLLLLPLIMLATHYDWHAVFEDPVFVVVNTILLCSPPALTLAQITAAVSGDAFERLISRTIFWSYCIITPPIMILSVLLGLMLSKF
ncbi:auxin efflux carrier [Panaeolus papilionaceus]|nr:auxin efflux carrier [Panaeolus papilionaceus]